MVMIRLYLMIQYHFYLSLEQGPEESIVAFRSVSEVKSRRTCIQTRAANSGAGGETS